MTELASPTPDVSHFDPLELLRRDDKWFMGGAPALLYAPPTPTWEHVPGLWDEAHFFHYVVQPVFTFALVDEHGHAVDLRARTRSWQPHVRGKGFVSSGIEVEERQTCGPEDVLTDVIEIRNVGSELRSLRLLAWTVQPVPDGTLDAAGEDDGALFVRRTVSGLRGTTRRLTLALDVEESRSWSIDLSEPCALQPHLYLTPYPETLSPSGLRNRASLSGVDRNGVVFAAIERPVVLEAGSTVRVTVRAALATSTEAAIASLHSERGSDTLGRSKEAWQAYFAQVPSFRCEDAWIEAAYYYRWYGLRLNTISRALGRYHHPAVAEGIGYFRVPISYSAQCHMLETRWMRDPTLARGSLLNFVDNQREDGSFPNHIYVDHVAPSGIYHADWGTRVMDVHRVHPDHDFLQRAYSGLSAYLEYFYRERDPQGSGLYDHVNQWESGQEYMSRYVWVDAEGDQWKEMSRKLKGIDASVYVYRCEQAMAEMSVLLGKQQEGWWRERAARTRAAILNHTWRDDLQAFVDVSPELEPSPFVFALSFYPFFTDLVGPEHLPSVHRWLLDPEEFWTPYPVPASPKSDPYFSAEPTWRGKRTNCPWNGRTWPMTNSHVAEALAASSQMDPSLRDVTAEFIKRFVRMMFFDGDPTRPNAFEHYNPNTGHPSRYRGIDDYMHSWIVDLIIKYVGGVRPDADGATIDPFPFDVRFDLSGVPLRGHLIDVSVGAAGYEIRLDGARVHSSEQPEEVHLSLA